MIISQTNCLITLKNDSKQCTQELIMHLLKDQNFLSCSLNPETKDQNFTLVSLNQNLSFVADLRKRVAETEEIEVGEEREREKEILKVVLK